ncbi:hypothetical protein PVNG_03489 [Plasmodium vivax North Korean]|uniref:PIR Superfamily Protein n=1 Tax=Plasmodium vivax North Korean TaxID=1035514 RepID=A0A0J9WE71_PLAVI|nr:hypothetical protein PVNG_03489 [Plasmodium vivax North Korean]
MEEQEDNDLDPYYKLNESLKEITIPKNTNLEKYFKTLDGVKDIDPILVPDEDGNPVFHDSFGDDHFSITDGVVNFDLQHIFDEDTDDTDVTDDTKDIESIRNAYYTFIKNYLFYDKKASDTSFFTGDSTKKCFYFKYWFYYYLIKNQISESIINEIFNHFFGENGEDDILKGYREQHSETCPIYRMELDKIKNIKILYDYLENYKNATNKSNIEEKIKESECCNSFNELIEEYNKKVACVSTDNNKDYCSELEYCRKIYQEIELKVLECVNNGKSKEPVSGEHGDTTTMGERGNGKAVEETRGQQSDNELEVLQNSPLYNLYIKFNNNDSLGGYASTCSILPKKTPSKKSEFQDLCKKLLRNREILKDQSDHSATKIDKCKYLNYWFYDQVLTNKFTHEMLLSLLVNGRGIILIQQKIFDKSEILETHNEFCKYYKTTNIANAAESVSFSKLCLDYISGCTNEDEKIKKICSANGTLLCKLLKENICSTERENSLCKMENKVLSIEIAQELPGTRTDKEMNGHANFQGSVNEYLPRAGSEHLPHAESNDSRVFMSKIVTPSYGALGVTSFLYLLFKVNIFSK